MLWPRSVSHLNAPVTIELPTQQAQTAFNLRLWSELLEDPRLARIEGRIETDRHGHILMSPPPGANHGSYQSEIAFLLRTLMQSGRTLTECPISTADGVRATDVAWASRECMRVRGNYACFPRSPEICVEVLSPSNTKAQIAEKMALYFDAGAREVGSCSSSGNMAFYRAGIKKPSNSSVVCPAFPKKVILAEP